MKWHLRLLQGRERPLVAGHPQQAVAKALFGSTHSCTNQEHQQRLNAGSEQLQDSSSYNVYMLRPQCCAAVVSPVSKMLIVWVLQLACVPHQERLGLCQ
jgi:hypothetical protein